MEAEKIMSIIETYLKKDFELGAKDRGFAAVVLTDFLDHLDKNDLIIVSKDKANGNSN